MRSKVTQCWVLITILLLAPVRSTAARPLPLVVQEVPTKYSVFPASSQPGQTVELIITSNKSDCASTGELAKAKLRAPEGVPIAVLATATQAPCMLTARIKIADSARIGKHVLWVENEKGPPLGIVEFEVTDSIPAGAIPPGLNPPAVDVMWSVMPKQIVSDNFGRAIANQYYAVEIIIGNNSAYTLQLVTVGFELPSDSALIGLVARNQYNKAVRSGGDATTLKTLRGRMNEAVKAALMNPVATEERATLLPTSSYKITRGTLEARQLTHARTLVLSTITALGPIFTGFTPYFHNVNHRSNFSEAINIFSNPLEKGLELAWPDQRPRQRERFDDQVLRDGLIIRNNTQVRTLAFFPKELLRLPKQVENANEYDEWKDNAREVRERLGKLVIIGDLIQYVNRISLIPNAPGPVAAPPAIQDITPNRIKQGEKQSFVIAGSNLQDAQVFVSQEVGIHFTKVNIDSTGHTITGEIEVDDTVAPGAYQVIVATPASIGTESRTLSVERADIEAAGELKFEAKPAGKNVPIEIEGTFLHNARFRMAASAPASISVTTNLPPPEDGKSLSGVVSVAAGTPPGKYEIEIFDINTPEKFLTKKFEVKAP